MKDVKIYTSSSSKMPRLPSVFLVLQLMVAVKLDVRLSSSIIYGSRNVSSCSNLGGLLLFAAWPLFGIRRWRALLWLSLTLSHRFLYSATEKRDI